MALTNAQKAAILAYAAPELAAGKPMHEVVDGYLATLTATQRTALRNEQGPRGLGALFEQLVAEQQAAQAAQAQATLQAKYRVEPLRAIRDDAGVVVAVRVRVSHLGESYEVEIPPVKADAVANATVAWNTQHDLRVQETALLTDLTVESA